MNRVAEPRGGSAPTPAQQVSLLSVPKAGTATVRLLGHARGILTHWAKKRPLACPGPVLCPSVVHRLSTVWKGYAPAELWREAPFRDWMPCVLEITERLWELMHGHALRGEVWELFRAAGDHGRVEVSGRLLDLLDPRGLRADVQVEPVVCRVYRTTEIAWDVGPVLPARQLLLPVTDAPPPTALPGVDPRTVVGTPEWETDQAIARAALKAALSKTGNGNGNGKGAHQ
jgi:hypothetical protein